ncbi:hypothetical protein ABW20_dc0110009 [Dactylellina cionopaga]|nr:hypothetical protein ABW20_dc0110009 [Dactylellina cionopaga]
MKQTANEIKDAMVAIRESLKELNYKVDDLRELGKVVVAKLTDDKMREVIKDYYQKELLSKHGSHQDSLLNLTLGSLNENIRESRYGSWLFNENRYDAWKHTSSHARAGVDGIGSNGDFGNEIALSNNIISEQISTTSTEPIRPILYLRGQAGFGKSVLMALAVKKLQKEHVVQHAPSKPESGKLDSECEIIEEDSPEKQPNTNRQCRPFVLFFFFKKGDNSTQLPTAAARTILSQIFEYYIDDNLEKMYEFVKKIRRREEEDLSQPSDSSWEGTGSTEESETFSQILDRVEEIIKYIGRKTYIVIDGIDECANRKNQGVMPRLAQLAKSSPDLFRILISSRDISAIKRELVTSPKTELEDPIPDDEEDAEEEGGEEIIPPTRIERITLKNSGYFECEYYHEAVILNISPNTNAEDMLSFLDISLRLLMRRGLPDFFLPDSDGYVKIKEEHKELENVINGMAEHIQRKSAGMFTYSAMTITNLHQPSELGLSERIRKLPDGMDEIYTSQLKSLTDAERRLIMLALKRIYWSNVCDTRMHTLEIAEEFKKYYDEVKTAEDESSVKVRDGFDYDHLIESKGAYTTEVAAQESMVGDDTGANQSVVVEDGGKKSHRRHHRHSPHSSGSFHQYSIQNRMRHPEVADIIYHLRESGLQVLTHPGFQETYMPSYPLPKAVKELLPQSEYEGAAIRAASPPRNTNSNALDEPPQRFNSGNGTSIKKYWGNTTPCRGEIHHWINHMKQLAIIWPPEKRTTEEWQQIWTLLKKFTNVQTIWRWAIQFRQFEEDISLQEANTEWRFWGPLHLSYHLNLEIYQQFLEGDKGCVHVGEFQRELGVENMLLYEDTFYSPKLIRKLARDKEALSLKREHDSGSPFSICVNLAWYEAKDRRGNNPNCNLVDSMKYLIELGPDLNYLHHDEPQIPLYRIIGIGGRDLFEYTVKNAKDGAFDVNLRNDSQQTVLHTIFLYDKVHGISYEDQLYYTERLLQLGANPNAEDIRSRMPLYEAVKSFNADAVKSILGFQYPGGVTVNIDDRDEEGDTALTMLTSQYVTGEESIKKGLDIIDSLIENGASLSPPEDSRTAHPWLNALSMSNFEFGTKLLNYHAKMSPGDQGYLLVRDSSNENALHLAVYLPNLQSVEATKMVLEHKELQDSTRNLLLESRQDYGDDMRTPPELALQLNKLDLFRYLILEAKADCETKDPLGQSLSTKFLQHWLAGNYIEYSNSNELIQELCGHCLSRCDILGVFHAAVRHGVEDQVKELLRRGADPFDCDRGCWDCFDWAYACGLQEMMKILIRQEVNYEARKEKHISPTEWDPDSSSPYFNFTENNLVATSIEFPQSESNDRKKPYHWRLLSQGF